MAIQQSQKNFLVEILRKTHDNNSDKTVIYPLLQENIHHLNNDFAILVEEWGTTILPKIDREQAKNLAADIVNLCMLISQFPLLNEASKREITIAGYKSVISVFPKHTPDWASIQNNLGIAYRNRVYGQKAANLENAIEYYKAALEVTDPLKDWANTIQNLGVTYKNRIIGEQSENIESAIECYYEALKIYDPQIDDYDFAMIQHNLGTALIYRIREDKFENVKLAIELFNQALQIRTFEKLPREWAMTQNMLGIAYWELNNIAPEETYVELTIEYFNSALKVYTRHAYPEQWGNLQNNLGNAYVRKSKQGGNIDNTEKAIKHFNSALEVRSLDSSPANWATTHNNLGEAYRQLIKGDKQANLLEAVNHFNNALKVRTKDSFPQFYIETISNLGLTYYELENYKQAYKILNQGINAFEVLRNETFSISKVNIDKQDDCRKIADKWHHLYQIIVDVCLKLDNDEEAIEYAERSKTRNLIAQILDRDLKNIFPVKIAIELEQLRDEIASDQYELQHSNSENTIVLAQYLNELREKRNKIQNEHLAVGDGFKFKEFQSTLEKNTAVIHWYITVAGVEVFIITHDKLKRLTPREPAQISQDLEDWTNNYLKSYHLEKNKWIKDLEKCLQDLSKIIEINRIIDSEELKNYSRLILIPHRYLHLLPLHALPLSKGNFLGDRFPKGISYVPSCQLLQLAQKRVESRQEFSTLFAIENPFRANQPKPLLGAKLEVNRICQYFAAENTTVISDSQATEVNLDLLKNKLISAHCVHFSCHAKFEVNAPFESALKLADPDGKLGKEADLTLEKIFTKINLSSCRLVTFSSCESGMTDSTSISDEYIGLPGGFLYAGSPCVVSALWTVSPLPTMLLLIKFYHNLSKLTTLEAGNIAYALNHAQRWLRVFNSKKLSRIQKSTKFQKLINESFQNEKHKKKFSDELTAAIKRSPYPFDNPYYWSAFIVTGI